MSYTHNDSTGVAPAAPDATNNASVPYDVNFCLPVRELESDRVRLTPFLPEVHAPLFVALSVEYPSIYEHITIGPFTSTEHFVSTILDGMVQPDPYTVLFAVYDLTRASTSTEAPAHPPAACFAGMFGLTRTAPGQLATELGWALLFPPFQRTHVATHAIGLLLDYCLSLPTARGRPLFVPGGDAPRGLGLRRVAWTTTSANGASMRAAERMGFRQEAVLRWARAFPARCLGNPQFSAPRAGDPKEDCPGQETVMFSVCWDDWEDGGREHARAMMQR